MSSLWYIETRLSSWVTQLVKHLIYEKRAAGSIPVLRKGLNLTLQHFTDDYPIIKEMPGFLFQTNGVDQQHAIIEYSEQEDCFVLQDLNSGQGTYVNDVRVQNAAVRLAPGDIIRFGYGGSPYELNIDNPPPVRDWFVFLFVDMFDKSHFG